jgi:2-oxoglutarate ferredoxin oxidoreductase subunit gamma
MSNQIELRLSGSGGQGLLLAGIILSEAAILENKNAIQTQSYGPEARGGASKAEVIISHDDIDFPKVTIPNIVLALTQIASDKYIKTVDEDGIVIVDDKIVLPSDLKAKKIIQVPILDTASEKVGKAIVANIVAIGVIVEATKVVSRASIEQAVLNRVPKGTEALNKAALEAGYALAQA